MARELIDAALAAADPRAAVARALGADGRSLAPSPTAGRLVVVGAGKAAVAMAAGAEMSLGGRIAEGLVIAPHGAPADGEALSRIRLRRAAHPVPDPAGLEATGELVAMADKLGADDTLLCLLSGGASALMTLPRPPLRLEDLQRTTAALLRAGTPIAPLNAVRKHLCQVKGGGLAATAAPARVLSLILSDVVGNRLAAIASGPTAADPTSFAEALAVVQGADVVDEVPEAALALLRRGAAGDEPETVKLGDHCLEGVRHVIVGDNARAAEAAAARARALGWRSEVVTLELEGQARVASGQLASLLQDPPLPRPCCLVLGGETTVIVRGPGRGGRNQELALAAAPLIAGLERVLLVTLATDGVDGPTDAAGAMVDGETAGRAEAAGLSIGEHLDANDAHPLLDSLGALIRLGPTGTNVNDLALLLAW